MLPCIHLTFWRAGGHVQCIGAVGESKDPSCRPSLHDLTADTVHKRSRQHDAVNSTSLQCLVGRAFHQPPGHDAAFEGCNFDGLAGGTISKHMVMRRAASSATLIRPTHIC